ncbi:hypothetical protein BGW39_005196 [Mortierella sp. 14UC]|nr:hypothetical protein BGW39_005196 [Mortierella sp. 14UC]
MARPQHSTMRFTALGLVASVLLVGSAVANPTPLLEAQLKDASVKYLWMDPDYPGSTGGPYAGHHGKFYKRDEESTAAKWHEGQGH